MTSYSVSFLFPTFELLCLFVRNYSIFKVNNCMIFTVIPGLLMYLTTLLEISSKIYTISYCISTVHMYYEDIVRHE